MSEWLHISAYATVAMATIADWHRMVSKHVPAPYLDEVFHVPQAQRYCRGDFTWDPKITTPPGLYLTSLLLKPILGCETSSLRLLNVGALGLIFVTSFVILRHLRSKKPTKAHLLDAHTALNICLFPPLFFFSGLYYTDVVSTLVVLLAYALFLKGSSSVPLGLIALCFRQTNIFWVAIFPAGLAVIDTLTKNGSLKSDGLDYPFDEILARSWTEGKIYDVSVQDATLQDYILVTMTVIVAALKSPVTILRVIRPYITLLVMFAIWVYSNGGVVLGDKSNHVATIHVPQMLYFWPYIFFFSFPLLLPLILGSIVRLLPASPFKSFCQDNLIGRTGSPTTLTSQIAFVLPGLAAVYLNTIVHPFTKADNRHYIFYAFRILLRHPAIKYAVVPLYYICAWLVIQALGTSLPVATKANQKLKRTPPTVNEGVRQSCQASFIIVWVATTALSVITAPLVEPRYFIIPWVIWRLHVPVNPALPSPGKSSGRPSYHVGLALETLWHLAINAVTGYVFLYRGFEWESEPGNIQRFIY